MEDLSETMAGFGTVEEVLKYLEPDLWQRELEDLYKPTWHIVGKSFLYQKKRGTFYLAVFFYS